MESQERYTRTLSYVAICLSMLCGGTTSLFATYGSSFSEVLGFTQYETNLVASLGDYAHYMSAPLFGYLALRTGPTRVIQAAALLMFLGYLGLSQALLGGLDHTQAQKAHAPQAHHYVATMSVLFALVGVGSKAAYMASMATAASNFRQSRYAGVALGVPLSLYGLSTFVFSSVKARWFEQDPTPVRYLAFMAAVSAAAHLLASRFVVLDGAPVAAARASVVAAKKMDDGAGAGPEGGEGGREAEAEVAGEPRSGRRRMTVAQAQAHSRDSAEDVDLTPPVTGASEPKPAAASPPASPATHPSPPLPPPPPSVLRAFATDPVAWALLLGLICFSGPGLAFVNNCGTMVRALSHGTALTLEQTGRFRDRVVATQSFFSFAARLSVGYVSDVWRTRLRLPRAALLVPVGLLMVYAQGAAARVQKVEELQGLAVLVGVAMGAGFTLAPTITSETWGAENFGVCWGVVTLGPAIGGHVCNLIFGSRWDEGLARIATRMAGQGVEAVCDNECFAPAFVVGRKIACLGLLFFAAVLCLPRAKALWARARTAP
ncbi:hypothetical protein LPJ53_003490 [Coemansia erecta]|uniref:MFS general substrate transporter n=1 Tax=Coemansia erecta TaxID=147472 RepID=A0A9W8CRX6_9FUNG|nr:hypothetical protein LPJ53_003490 [Coemansia erecta]